MSEIKIIVTHDGSQSLYNEALNETYHSIHGAINESIHVFIKNGFNYVLQSNKQEPIAVLEIGFGTGLNTLLTVTESSSVKKKVSYTALETYPLPENIWMKLKYPDPQQIFNNLHQASWEEWNEISTDFKLLKKRQSLQEANLPQKEYDLVYFDAFAPNKQPEMWEVPILHKVVEAMKPGGVFITYCAKGQLKRDLKSLGLIVESLPGPPGKREMVRAIKS